MHGVYRRWIDGFTGEARCIVDVQYGNGKVRCWTQLGGVHLCLGRTHAWRLKGDRRTLLRDAQLGAAQL